MCIYFEIMYTIIVFREEMVEYYFMVSVFVGGVGRGDF